MSRIHLFELEDQSWFPDPVRRGITDFLQFAANLIDLYKNMIPVIVRLLQLSKEQRIVDLGSGGGGGIEKIHRHLKEEGHDIAIKLTDKYPNLDAMEALSKRYPESISFVGAPVDAREVPSDLKGIRTLFVAFHHFRPEDAKKILRDAAENKAPIGIFEATERSFFNFIIKIFDPIAVMLAVPFIRPFSWSRIFFTYIIPLIPFSLMWDGMVSVLRTYSIREMNELTEQVKVDGYRWETGRLKPKKGPSLLYLIGYPVNT
jgi:Fe-S-cluster formation regulator IscX/YfhJ